MEFIEAKCPICAKRIQVPSDNEKPYCAYCGAQFLKDAALAYAGTAGTVLKEEPSNPSDFVIVGGTLVDYRGSDAEVNIPEGVTCIGESAFSGNRSIVSVAMPDTVTTIAREAFKECSSLQSVRISESLVTIESYGFYKCTSLKEVRLPRTTKKLGYRCFAMCSSMDVVYHPTGISCDNQAFDDNPAKRVNI